MGPIRLQDSTLLHCNSPWMMPLQKQCVESDHISKYIHYILGNINITQACTVFTHCIAGNFRGCTFSRIRVSIQ